MTHPAIARYNEVRDREQHDFERSTLGETVRQCMCGYFAHLLKPEDRQRYYDMRAALALEAVVGASMPAFYAGRKLQLW